MAPAPRTRALALFLDVVGRGAIGTRHRDTQQPVIDAELGPVVDEMAHHEAANRGGTGELGKHLLAAPEPPDLFGCGIRHAGENTESLVGYLLVFREEIRPLRQPEGHVFELGEIEFGFFEDDPGPVRDFDHVAGELRQIHGPVVRGETGLFFGESLEESARRRALEPDFGSQGITKTHGTSRGAGQCSRTIRVPMRRFVLLSCLLLPLPAAAGEFQSRSAEIAGRTILWQVYVPDAVLAGEVESPPVVLFLHGRGESGTDGERQTRIGLPRVIRERGDFPAVVVMPQTPRSAWWGDEVIAEAAIHALDAAMAEFGGDPDRVYLTGLSLGGYGTWAFAYRHPERFAALVPVCGGVSARRSRMTVPEWHPASVRPEDPHEEAARVLSDIPIWIFHGADDRTVPVSESRRMARALEAAGGRPRYTEYAGVGHDSWVRAYREEGLYDWLFSHRR